MELRHGRRTITVGSMIKFKSPTTGTSILSGRVTSLHQNEGEVVELTIYGGKTGRRKFICITPAFIHSVPNEETQEKMRQDAAKWELPKPAARRKGGR